MAERAGSLLTMAIEKGFTEPMWTSLPEICEGAEILLLPLRIADEQEMQRKFSICTDCGGYSPKEPADGAPPLAPDQKVCPTCKGEGKATASDSTYMKTMLERLVRDWRIKAEDPRSGELVAIAFSPAVRDAVTEVPAAYLAIIIAARNLVYHRRNEAKKGSPTQPSPGSPTASAQDGTETSASTVG